MATLAEVKSAKRVLRQYAWSYGKRRGRIHSDVLDNAYQQARALEGVCGGCPLLHIKTFKAYQYERVQLNCDAGIRIMEMIKNTEHGKDPKCKISPVQQAF
jgi:hypothetical protein